MRGAAYLEPAAQLRDGPALTRGFFVRLARGATFTLALQVAGAGLTYISQIAFARWMGVSQFGFYAYLIAWTTILALLAGLGFPLSVLRFIPEYRTLRQPELMRGLVHVSRRATVLTGTLAAATAVAVAAASASLPTVVAVGLAAWLIPVGALINVDVSIIRAGGRVIGAFAPSQVIRPVITLAGAGVVWLVSKRLTADAGLLITLAAFAAVAALQWWLVRDVIRRDAPPHARSYERRRWFRVSMPLLLVASFQIAIGQTDLLIVGAVRGVRSAGLYLAASKTVSLVGYLLLAFSAVAAPLFSELYAKGDRTGLQRLATVAAQWVFWPTLVLTLGLALLATDVLKLFGPDFAVARGALLILLLGQIVSAGCGAVGYLLSMTGHQNDMARAGAVVAVFNIAICYLAARTFGLDGAACATTISVTIWNLWLHRLTVKRIGVHTSIFSYLLLRRTSRKRTVT